jgi:tRNA threonylcarbamoyladenosine biosynthesis protein TsaB
MSVLAISSVAETIVAVRYNGATFFRVNTERRGQAEFLVPLINEVLEEAGIKFAQLTRVGVCTGPGSFTGLRVGIATAQGIALGTNLPCVGVDAFTFWRIAARRSGIHAPLAVALDTLRDDMFMAVYDGYNSQYQRTLLEAQVIDTVGAEKLLNENTYLSLIGDAYTQLPQRTFVPITHTIMADALLDCVAAVDPATAPALPVYLRAPDVTV